MISLIGNSRPEDTNGVVEIIKLLSDGPAYQKRFDEIKQMAEVAEKKLRDGRQLEEKYNNAERMLADATALLAKHKTREAGLNSREEAVAARESAVDRTESQMKDRHQAADHALSQREDAVSSRERDVERAEATIKAASAKLEQDRSAFDAKVAKHLEHARAMLG